MLDLGARDNSWAFTFDEATGTIKNQNIQDQPERILSETLLDCLCKMANDKSLSDSIQLGVLTIIKILGKSNEFEVHGPRLSELVVTLYNIYLSTIRFPFFRASKGVMSQMQLIFRCA